MCLLNAGIHEYGAARAEIDGALGEDAELRELAYFIAEGVGEGLQKASAARGARLVKEDVVDSAVVDLEALYVLSADVDDELDVGHEELGGGEVRYGFDDAVVNVERVFDYVLAVARDSR